MHSFTQASLDEVMSYVPEESSRTAVVTFLTNNRLLRATSRCDKKYNPVNFIKWAYASQFAQLLEMGCSIDIDQMLELFHLLIRQIEKVYRLSSPICYSLWIFLKEVPTVNGHKLAAPEDTCQMVYSETRATDLDNSLVLDELAEPFSSQSSFNTPIGDLSTDGACRSESDDNAGINGGENGTEVPGIFAEN